MFTIILPLFIFNCTNRYTFYFYIKNFIIRWNHGKKEKFAYISTNIP